MTDTFKFPGEFDLHHYKANCPAARNMDFKDACLHFLKIGKKRGLAGSLPADMNLFAGMLNGLGFGRILEIGPGVQPRMKGDNVFYYDVRHGENFREYARAKGVTDPAALPEIHYHADDGSLRGIDQKFDLVFSSHCIEHVYDLVAHVNDVASILNDGGVYALIVPDKRYTFDHFRTESTLGDALERHGNGRHSLKTFIDSLNKAHNEPVRHWQNDHGEPAAINGARVADAIKSCESLEGRDPSLHAWVFTDDSFRALFAQLADTGFIRLAPTRIYNTLKHSNSFCVVMEKTGER
jgi:SAM-dependent methyltransferase